jgi:predicted DsbA family dithiol-disulfide isomerase
MKVEIWSDVVCPWCYIGKRRFETALAEFAHRDGVEIIWRSFQLDPTAPPTTTGSLDEMLAAKYGVSRERARAMNANVTALAAEDGLDYHLDRARHGNTFDAHRLIHLAAAHGQQGAMKERLLQAYFSEGEAVSDRDTLVRLAAEVGIPAEEARTALAGDTYAKEVRADLRRAQMFGIRGVPFFAIDEKYGISGAQPTEVMLAALEQAWADEHPLIAVAGAADGAGVCEDDSCAVPAPATGQSAAL